MSNLFLLQSSFATTAQAIAKLKALYHPNDQVVLMGDAAQFSKDPFIQQLKHVYILQTDVDLLMNLNTEHIQVIEYNTFADLCLQHARCITFK